MSWLLFLPLTDDNEDDDLSSPKHLNPVMMTMLQLTMIHNALFVNPHDDHLTVGNSRKHTKNLGAVCILGKNQK